MLNNGKQFYQVPKLNCIECSKQEFPLLVWKIKFSCAGQCTDKTMEGICHLLCAGDTSSAEPFPSIEVPLCHDVIEFGFQKFTKGCQRIENIENLSHNGQILPMFMY